jgi:membrane protein DedA with SNARE-associated domain
VSSYLGSLPFYFLGYRGHRAKINSFVEKYGNYFFIKAEEVKRGFDLFHKYGNFFIFFGRLIPVVRTFVSFPAGAIRMNFWSFSALTILGGTIWSAFLSYAGYIL